jgi:hypothetical protein
MRFGVGVSFPGPVNLSGLTRFGVRVSLAPTGSRVTSVNLSGLSLSNLGAQDQGAVIGAITVTGTQTTPVVLGGPDAAKFAVTDGGIVPCNLIAAVDIPAGSYSITLSAT